MIEKIITLGDGSQIKFDYRVEVGTSYNHTVFEKLYVSKKEKGKRKWNRLKEFGEDYEFRELDMSARERFILNYYRNNVPDFDKLVEEIRDEAVEHIRNKMRDKSIVTSANIY